MQVVLRASSRFFSARVSDRRRKTSVFVFLSFLFFFVYGGLATISFSDRHGENKLYIRPTQRLHCFLFLYLTSPFPPPSPFLIHTCWSIRRERGGGRENEMRSCREAPPSSLTTCSLPLYNLKRRKRRCVSCELRHWTVQLPPIPCGDPFAENPRTFTVHGVVMNGVIRLPFFFSAGCSSTVSRTDKTYWFSFSSLSSQAGVRVCVCVCASREQTRKFRGVTALFLRFTTSTKTPFFFLFLHCASCSTRFT